jgi:hypothetical protein
VHFTAIVWSLTKNFHRVYDKSMEDAPDNGKNSPHSAHANGIEYDKRLLVRLRF